MPIYNLVPPTVTANNTEIEARLGDDVSSPNANSINGRLETAIQRLATLLTNFGTSGDAGNISGSLLAKIVAISAFLDGLETTLGSAIASPEANSVQARLQGLIDRLGAAGDTASATGALLPRLADIKGTLTQIRDSTRSPGAATTTTVSVTSGAGVELLAADSNNRMRLVTIQVEAGEALNLYNAANSSGIPRIRALPVGVVYELSYRGQLWGACSVTGQTTTVNITADAG